MGGTRSAYRITESHLGLWGFIPVRRWTIWPRRLAPLIERSGSFKIIAQNWDRLVDHVRGACEMPIHRILYADDWFLLHALSHQRLTNFSVNA